ncbi:unnamed protein product [Plasmodium vivax]|uniref:Uncharacterized protein n=2 Tax=Plasmodium vivax TaxID=5855 RepID=A0A0J9SUJ5_PLAV1|nr:hypothetical protein PVBG_04680 [Plasmodium vivax Brazil I]CAG9477163.1 unnamed protein product [Plasmodium vivax]SCO67478.1 conserved Plasmodium protein, unknown function [Plasmodium vivax]
MPTEKKNLVNNVIYQCHGKLKLYIKVKQRITNHGAVGREVEKLKEGYKKCVNSNSARFRQVECCYDGDANDDVKMPSCADCSSEDKLNKEILNGLLRSHAEYGSGCVVSFVSNANKSHTCKYNSDGGKRNDPVDSPSDGKIKNLVDIFFKKKNGQRRYSLRYGFLNSRSWHDLLQNCCEHKAYYQKIKSCTLRSDERNVKGRINSERGSKINGPPKSELKKFREKTTQVEFSDAQKLKDILHFAAKEERAIKREAIKKGEHFFCTLVSIHVSSAKGEGALAKDFMSDGESDTAGRNNFFFVNVYCGGRSEKKRGEAQLGDAREAVHRIDAADRLEAARRIDAAEPNVALAQLSDFVRQPLTGEGPPVDISHFNRVAKMICELYCSTADMHLKVCLNMCGNSGVKEEDEPIFNFLCSVDAPLEEFLTLFIKDVTKSQMGKGNLGAEREHGKGRGSPEKEETPPKLEAPPKSDAQKRIENALFGTIPLDEETKSALVTEAMNFPEQHLNKLASLNKTLQHNYALFKEREKNLHSSIARIVEKQNQMMRHYEEEEKKQKNEIIQILQEISFVSEQNVEIKNEIENHKGLNLKYGEMEKDRQEQHLKKFQSVDTILEREFESFLKFRHESLVNTEWDGKGEKKGSADGSSNNKREERTSCDVKSTSQDAIRDIRKKQEEQYLKNLNEAMNHAEKIFRETQDVRKRYDEAIRQKAELFSTLKDTAVKFNERANFLMNNFKGTKGLKLVTPIEDKCVNFMEKYERQNLVINNDMREYRALLEELQTRNFNERQLRWIHKMSSLSKHF